MGRTSQNELLANAIVYTYPCGNLDIVCASDKVWVPEGWEESENFSRPGRVGPAPEKRQQGAKSQGDDMLRSMRRARAEVRRKCLANDFRYFVTLTIDPGKLDRYDAAAVSKRLSQWCSNMVKRHGMAYVIVPEQHQDGAWHFHGLVAGDLGLVDSGTIKVPGSKKPRKPRSAAQREEWMEAGGQVVYNLPAWPYGFSTALELQGEYPAAVAYVCKYIGKQQGQRPMGRWYYSGGALRKPEKTYAVLDYRGLLDDYQVEAVELDIPGSKLAVVHTRLQK